jgi:hypothetical protein
MKSALKRMVHGEEFKKWAYGTEIEKAQATADKKAIEVYTAILCGEVEFYSILDCPASIDQTRYHLQKNFVSGITKSA